MYRFAIGGQLRLMFDAKMCVYSTVFVVVTHLYLSRAFHGLWPALTERPLFAVRADVSVGYHHLLLRSRMQMPINCAAIFAVFVLGRHLSTVPIKTTTTAERRRSSKLHTKIMHSLRKREQTHHETHGRTELPILTIASSQFGHESAPYEILNVNITPTVNTRLFRLMSMDERECTMYAAVQGKTRNRCKRRLLVSVW